jgi:hypothetical protein
MMFPTNTLISREKLRSLPLTAFTLFAATLVPNFAPNFAMAQTQPTAPVKAPATIPALRQAQVATFEARKAALNAREAAALQAHSPADPELLEQLDLAGLSGADPAMLEWEEQSFVWFSEQIATASLQEGSQFPATSATLNVAMMRMQLAYTLTRPDTEQKFPVAANAPVLQVARVGNPVQAVLWVAGFGYASVPAEYVQPYVDRTDPQTALEIGRTH